MMIIIIIMICTIQHQQCPHSALHGHMMHADVVYTHSHAQTCTSIFIWKFTFTYWIVSVLGCESEWFGGESIECISHQQSAVSINDPTVRNVIQI